MPGFEYNEIRIDAVEDVELIAPEHGGYTEFKQDIYHSDDQIPEARQRLLEHTRVDLFPQLLEAILDTDPEKFMRQHVEVGARLPDYVENPDELKSAVKMRREDEVDVEIDDTAHTRGQCRYSKDDDYRPDNDDALVCWKCSDDDTRKPKKLLSDDEPGETCTRYTAAGFKLLRHLSDNLRLTAGGGLLVNHLRRADVSVSRIRSRLFSAQEQRSQAVNLAFKTAFPDEDYYYQRAEALLRDLDADVAKDTSPGSGGREFEREAIKRLNERFTLRDETVFKIIFRDDAPEARWRDFVEDPSEPTYKEADAIIEGDIGPIVVDFFTQRRTREKRKQVHNYAELYEKATGDEAHAWGVTDSIRGELLELDTLTGTEPDPPDIEGQAGLSDFI
jgi:hypothetical protein